MASINSAGFYAQMSAKNKAIGGLASGLDTDALVEALTMATRTKLAKQTQQKTLLGWKMTAYRSVASTMRAFQTKHISLAGGTNSLRANAFFNTFKGVSSSDKVTAKPGTGAIPGSFTIDSIKQLATNQTFTTDRFTKALEGNEIDLSNPDTDFVGKTLQLQMGNTTKTINLDTLQGKTGQDFEDELQRLVNSAFGQKSEWVSVGSAEGDPGYPGHYIQVDAIKVDFDSADGKKGTIKLDGGTSVVTVKNNSDSLGLTSGNTNRINLSSKISEFFPGLEGESFKFTINDKEFTMSADDTVNSFMTRVNNSTAGVRVQFDSTKQTFVFTSKVTGAGDNLRMQDIEGSFLHTFIGAQGGNVLSTGSYTDATRVGNNNLAEAISFLSLTPDNLEDYKFNMTIGDKTAELSLDVSAYKEAIDDGDMTLGEAIIQSLNDQIKEEFGEDTGVSFSLGESGNVIMNSTKNDNLISLSAEPLSPAAIALSHLGIGGSNKALGLNTNLKDLAGFADGDKISFTLGGEDFEVELDEDMTLQNFIDAVNDGAGREIMTFKDGKLTLDGKSQPIAFSDEDSDVMARLFGKSSHDVSASAGYLSAMASGAGKNAEIIVGGEVLVSSSNTFTINGCDIEINAESEVGDKPITVTVSSNPDDVVDKIKGFIEEYNALVDFFDSLVRETKVAGYEPLTDEQRAEMSEDQIKQWESEAKKGLLYGDSTIRGIMQQMRTALYSKVESAGISLYDIGITTESMLTAGANYRGNGRLEMTEAGEARLRNALEQNPDAVRELFTNSKDGLAVQLDNIINDATRTNSTNQGTLVSLAGTEALTGNNSSFLSRKIDDIDKQIALLKTRLENEYNRNWRRFSALETALSRMNTQSSWLADFGSN